MRVFIEPNSVRSSAGALRSSGSHATDISRWARTATLPEMPAFLRAEAEATLRVRIGLNVQQSAGAWGNVARELNLRADLADAQQGKGFAARLRALFIEAQLVAGPRSKAARHGISYLGKVAKALGTEARGRPRSLSRALLRGNPVQRAANTGKYLRQRWVGAVHSGWNGLWKRSGLQSLKPPWGKIAGSAKWLGRAAGIVEPVVETYTQVRQHHYARAVSTLGATVVTTPARLVDFATGGSVTGYVKIAFETPVALFHGDKGIGELADRIEHGDYGPLPKWEAKYVGNPLGNLIYDHLVAH
jgi:hypothetical protein